jgi:hypothetical protein
MTQVLGNTESQRRQYGLTDQARAAGFATVEVIDEDPGGSGSGTIRMVFAQYRTLGSALQLFLWAREAGFMLPVVQRNVSVCKITSRPPAYHTVVQILHNPIYAGACVFARRSNRIRIEDIQQQIREARLVIAEITPQNANVYYEVGYADALR